MVIDYVYKNRKWLEIDRRTKCHVIRVFPRLTRSDDDKTDETFYEQMVRLHVPCSEEPPVTKQDDESWQSVYMRHKYRQCKFGTAGPSLFG